MQQARRASGDPHHHRSNDGQGSVVWLSIFNLARYLASDSVQTPGFPDVQSWCPLLRASTPESRTSCRTSKLPAKRKINRRGDEQADSRIKATTLSSGGGGGEGNSTAARRKRFRRNLKLSILAGRRISERLHQPEGAREGGPRAPWGEVQVLNHAPAGLSRRPRTLSACK